MMPERIQLRRTKGWRKPEGAVVVARPSRWGNPFIVGKWFTLPLERGRPKPIYVRDRAHAKLLYNVWLTAQPVLVDNFVPLLRGHDLACWCPLDQPCHADVLLKIANAA